MTNHQDDPILAGQTDIDIPTELHVAYIKYHDEITERELSGKEARDAKYVLVDPNTNHEEKKKLLFRLAHAGTIESVNALQEYLKKPDPDLRAWTILCFNEARTHVQANELGVDPSLIMAGAGGSGDRLRCYFVISVEQNNQFDDDQKTSIQNVAANIAEELDCVSESIEFGPHYAVLSALIHIDVAPAEFIEEVINKSNDNQTFLRHHYLCVNTRKPKKEDVEEYLKGLE